VERIALGRRGAETLRSQMGATQRTMQALEYLLTPAANAQVREMTKSRQP